jgi:hypothetical protein
MEKITAYARICFPDGEQQQYKVMRDLFDLLVKTEAMPSDNIIHLYVEDEELCIELDKGFQLLLIPIRYVKEALAMKEEA